MDPRNDQYEAAAAEAEAIVRADKYGFTAEQAVPACITEWRERYAREFALLRKCPHGGMSQVHTVFGCEPNRAYCNAKCAKRRRDELLSEALSQTSRGKLQECDFCHLPKPMRNADGQFVLVPVAFAVAAIVVRARLCGDCLLAPAREESRNEVV